MQVEQKKTVQYVLTLTAEEAHWLKALVQNPLGVSYEDEPLTDREMRGRFFDALSWSKEG